MKMLEPIVAVICVASLSFVMGLVARFIIERSKVKTKGTTNKKEKS
jgi:hypothetical protein